MALVALTRLSVTFDLSAFMPRQSSPLQEVLVEQIRNGPASRLLVTGISGSSEDVLYEAGDELKRALADHPAFSSVANGEFALDGADVPVPIDRYFLLMRDLDLSAEGLAAAVGSRLRDLAFAGGRIVTELIARDPFLATLDILEGLSPAEVGGGPWMAADGSAVLIAETQAGAIDIAAQREAVEAVRSAFAALPNASNLDLEITGAGAFGVELQEIIRAEATLRSILAIGSLMVVILLAFRSARLIVLSALPLAMGFLGGLALVSLLFEPVHGITLAFGFTLLGVAIDYPIHLFSHAKTTPGPEAMHRIWPTIRLGVISTSLAYLALVFSGSSGLAQLGAFTTAGVVVAALVTRTWLPFLVAAPAGGASAVASGEASDVASGEAEATRPTLSLPLCLIALFAATAVGWLASGDGLWDDDVRSLSPVPAERLAADRLLRAAAATPDMRHQIVMINDSLDALLADCERADRLLDEARSDGLVASWQAVCQVVPSAERQAARQAAIPDEAALRAAIESAIAGTPFRSGAFDPFIDNALAARSLDRIEPADFAGTPLAAWLDAHLVELESGWVALISLVDPMPAALAERVAEWSVPATVVDIQAATVDLMRDYRRDALTVSVTAALMILALLWFSRGELRQASWVGLTVTAAVAVTVAVATLVHGSLTVMHLVALLLVLGLGLDYSLFMSRVESLEERRQTRRSIMLCAVSTTIAFGILATSSIPVLQYLGLTVATGSAASYLLAHLGSGR